MKNIFLLLKKLKHTCAYKSLLSIYMIHNFIIYRFVSPCRISVHISVCASCFIDLVARMSFDKLTMLVFHDKFNS